MHGMHIKDSKKDLSNSNNSIAFKPKNFPKGPLPTLTTFQSVNEIAKNLLSADSWEFVADKVLYSIAELTQVYKASLIKFSFNSDDSLLAQRTLFEYPASSFKSDLTTSNRNSAEELIFNDVYSGLITDLKQKYIVQINSKKANEITRIFFETLNINSIVATPIFFQEKLWGILLLQEQDQERRWSSGNLEVIKMISELLSSAIEGDLVVRSLKETESRFQIVSRATNDAIYDWNLKEDKIWRSPNTELIFGYKKEELSHINWWQKNIHPDDKTRVIDELIQINHSVKGFWSTEYRFKRGNGEYIYILDRAYFAFDESGEPVRMIGSMQDITKSKKNEVCLEDSRNQLRKLALRSQSIREEERKFLARELHDEFAQVLTGIKFNIEWLGTRIAADDTAMQECIKETSDVILETMEKTKQIAMALRPNIIDDIGLIEAIKWQLSQFKQKTKHHCYFESNIEDLDLSDEATVAIFRVFQEALSNIARHAKASKVDVSFDTHEQGLTLRVVDDGNGIPEVLIENNESIGLLGMRERASAIGGRLVITRGRQYGTVVTLEVPIAKSKKIRLLN